MRKKTILSIGGLTLAVGLGVAAFSGATLPLAFSAVTTGTTTTVEKVLELVATTPENDEQVAIWQVSNQITVQFGAGDQAGSWDGLTGINPDCAEPIKIGKPNNSWNGLNEYYTGTIDVPAAAISISDKNPNVAIIDVTKIEGWEWDSDNREYWVEIPAGYFLGGELSEGSGSETDPDIKITKFVTPRVGFGWTVNNSPKYTTTPAAGAKLNSAKNELYTVTMNFPTDITAVVNEEAMAVAELYYIESGTRSLKGTYTAKADGNVVTLSLSLIQGISTLPGTVDSKQQYYEVVIPAGIVNCLQGENLVGQNVGTTINNLKYVFTFDASAVKVLDEDGEEITSLSTKDFTPATSGAAKDGTCFYLEFPCAITYTGTAYSAAYLYMGTMTTPSFASFYISVEGTNTVKLQMKNPQASSVVNHPELWYNGDNYNFGIPANVIQIVGETAKLPATRFKNFEITDGVTAFDVTLTGINASANALPDYANELVPTSEPLDGQKPTFYVQSQTEKETKVAPSDFGAIKPEVGVSYLQFTSPVTFGLNPATQGTAKISLVKVGQEEPIWSQTNEGKVNVGHLFKGRATRTLINTSIAGGETGTGTSWYFYNDFEKNAEGGYVYSVTKSMTAANVNKTNYYGSAYATPEFITEPGEYKYIIDEGFFVSSVTGCPAIPNAYTEIPFTIIGDDMKVDYTFTPEAGANVSSLSTVVIEYPEGATIQLADGAKAEVRTYSSFLNEMNDNPMASYPMTVTAEDNKVTLALATPLTEVLQAAYVVKIPAAAWTIQIDGKAIANESAALKYYINTLGQGTMVPAPTTGDETVAPGLLQNPVYTSLMPVYDHGTVSTVGNLTLNKVSYEEVDGVQTLVKGDQVTTYTWTGSQNSAESQTECVFTAASTFDANDLASGLYAIYIPKDYFKYKGFTTSPQDKDFVFVYNVKGSVAADFVRAQPSSYNTAWLTNGYQNLQTVAWELNQDFKVNAASTDKVKLTRDGVTVAEATVADVEYDEGYPSFKIPASVTFHFPGEAADFNVTGIYKVEVPAGFFTLDNQPVEAFYKAYNYTYNKRTPDFTYELDPAPVVNGEDVEVESLETITVNFTKCYDLNYAGSVAKLTSEDGTIELTCNYPSFVENSSSNHGLKFTFGNANTPWKSGKYTFEILPNSVMLEDPAWDEEEGTGNFEGLKVEYTLHYVAPFVLEDHMTLACPSSFAASQANSQLAMGLVMLDLDVKSDVFKVAENPEFVTISYSPTKEGEYTVLKTLNPAGEGQAFVMDGMGMGAGTGAPSTLMLNFIEDGDGGFDYDLLPTYSQVGYYHIVIPNGIFTVEGKGIIGCELDYTYGLKEPDLTYTLTPADGSVIEDLKSLITQTEGIKVTFPNAESFDVMDDPEATLTMPDGTVLDASTWFDGLHRSVNYVRFYFPGLKNAFQPEGEEWPSMKGNYTFKVPAKAMAIDLGYFEDETVSEGNSPEIVATYVVGDDSIFTGVLLIGVEGADAYTVYTLDGKLVKANANAADLRELENGLYIINGKKALLRK